MAKDHSGKDLQPGDHVFIPATVAKIDTNGKVSVILDHATHAEHAAHETAVAAWKDRPISQVSVDCPAPPVATQAITIDDARHLEFHSRPAPGSPIFDRLGK